MNYFSFEVIRHFGQVFCRAARSAVEKFCSCYASAASMLNRFSMIKNGATRARVSYRGLPVYIWNPYPQSTSENVRTFNFFPRFPVYFFIFFYLFIYLVIYLSLSFIIIITCIISIVCFSVFITLCLEMVLEKKINKQKTPDPFSFTYSTTVCGRYKYEKANMKKIWWMVVTIMMVMRVVVGMGWLHWNKCGQRQKISNNVNKEMDFPKCITCSFAWNSLSLSLPLSLPLSSRSLSLSLSLSLARSLSQNKNKTKQKTKRERKLCVMFIK